VSIFKYESNFIPYFYTSLKVLTMMLISTQTCSKLAKYGMQYILFCMELESNVAPTLVGACPVKAPVIGAKMWG
jgi:hypothetical protein